MRPLRARDLVRGQFAGYRDEPGVAADSDVETFCALRLFIDSWRWAGVPWYLRSGKCLPLTASEVVVELKPPPQPLFADAAPARGAGELPPLPALPRRGDRARRARQARRRGVRRRCSASSSCSTTLPDEESPYERLLGDAMAGDGALFTREDAVEAAWAVVDPVLENHHRARPYKRGTWGPAQAAKLIAPDGRWHNPAPSAAAGERRS